MEVDELVPVRLRLQLGDQNVIETFLWNSNEGVTHMHRFSEDYCTDVGIPVHLAPVLTEEIQKQVDAWEASTQSQVSIGPIGTEERLEILRLDFAVGATRFTDQFIWDINSSSASPEEFALQVGHDLQLDPAVVVEIACAIREQVAHLRRRPPAAPRPAEKLVREASKEVHTLTPSKKRFKRQPGGEHASRSEGGFGRLKSRRQQARCIRGRSESVAWGPRVRVMDSREALLYGMEKARRAAQAAEEGGPAWGRKQLSELLGEEAEEGGDERQRRQQEGMLSRASTLDPGAELDTEAPWHRSLELRPRRSVRLTETLLGMKSPRGSVNYNSRPAVSGSEQQASAGEGGAGAEAGALLPSASPFQLEGPFAAVAGAGGRMAPTTAPPQQLSRRQQQMLLLRRQLMMRDTTTPQGTPSPEVDAGGLHPQVQGQQLAGWQQQGQQAQQRGSWLGPASTEAAAMPAAHGMGGLLPSPGAGLLPQGLLPSLQHDVLGAALGGGGGGVAQQLARRVHPSSHTPSPVPWDLFADPVMPPTQGVAAAANTLPFEDTSPLPSSAPVPPAATASRQRGGGRGSGRPRRGGRGGKHSKAQQSKQNPYAGLFGEMFEGDEESTMQIDDLEQPPLLLDGTGSSNLIAGLLDSGGLPGLRDSGQAQQAQQAVLSQEQLQQLASFGLGPSSSRPDGPPLGSHPSLLHHISSELELLAGALTPPSMFF